MWITNSGEAETFLVFANVDPSAGYKGITCFVVDKDMGVEIAKKEKKLGIRASSTCLLNFDDIKVPKENIVGEIGKGYKIAIEILNEGRIGIAAQMIGIAQGAFDKSLGYAYQRKQFGKAVGEFQGMAFQFSQIATEIEAARLLTYNAARLKEEGRVFTKEAAMAKLYASQVAQKASGAAIEWAGGVGFTRETGIEKVSRLVHLADPSSGETPRLVPSTKAQATFNCRRLQSFCKSSTSSAFGSGTRRIQSCHEMSRESRKRLSPCRVALVGSDRPTRFQARLKTR